MRDPRNKSYVEDVMDEYDIDREEAEDLILDWNNPDEMDDPDDDWKSDED